MGVKVAQLQPLLPHATSSSHGFVSPTISSPPLSCSKSPRGLSGHTIRLVDHQALFLGSVSIGLWRTRSLENPSGRGRRRGQTLRRAISASLESFPDDEDEEFLRKLQELTANLDSQFDTHREPCSSSSSSSAFSPSCAMRPPIYPEPPLAEPSPLGIRPEPGWQDEIVLASVERKANSVELPLSLRIIKRKKRLDEGFREAGESACCSVKKAFSSMVFIIRELQSYTLRMREVYLYQDLQGILARVQQEMHASFVWLFQQVFSCTPTLMLSVMLLLANFTVYSMAHDPALAATPPNPPSQSVVAVAENDEHKQQRQPRFDSSSIKTFSVGRTAAVGGNNGGGGKARPVAGATDDGRSDGSSRFHSRTIISDGFSTVPATVTEEGGSEEASCVVTEEEEATVWNRVVEETTKMRARTRHEALMDHQILQLLVSPVAVEMEPEAPADYLQTELMYHQAVSQDPNNPLLLANFAQFLYLVLHDHDRAEYYFKRAVGIKPADAESLSRYASFLWLARKDLGAAEETYLEAIAADPGNTYHAANYAHFLWSTGGEDTCYPLDGPECA